MTDVLISAFTSLIGSETVNAYHLYTDYSALPLRRQVCVDGREVSGVHARGGVRARGGREGEALRAGE